MSTDDKLPRASCKTSSSKSGGNAEIDGQTDFTLLKLQALCSQEKYISSNAVGFGVAFLSL